MPVFVKKAAFHFGEELAERKRPIGDGKRGARARHQAAGDHQKECRRRHKRGVSAQAHISCLQDQFGGTSRWSGSDGCTRKARDKPSEPFHNYRKAEARWWSTLMN